MKIAERDSRTRSACSSLYPSLILLATSLMFLCSCRQSTSAKRGGEPLTQKAVKSALAEIKPMERTVVVTGSFHAREQSTLSVKVPGRLERIAVDIGSVVRKGDELAQI